MTFREPEVDRPRHSARWVLGRLRGVMASLSPSEGRVAAVAFKDPAGASASTIGELAARCETSETTVLRLCRTLGFRGYPEFRLALAAAAAEAHSSGYVGGEILAEDTTAEIVGKIAGSSAESVMETAAVLSSDVVEEAAGALATARRIDVFGVGASALVAQELQYKLHRIDLICHAFTDARSALSSAALLQAGDVAVMFSHSGQAADALEYVKTAQERGARTLVVTNDPMSPLATAGDLLLLTAAVETTLRSGVMASRIAQLTVVDVLFTLVARADLDRSKAALEATREAQESRGR